MSAIRVDDYVWKHSQNRYRFSLAHEIAHAVLHAWIYRQLTFANIAEWKAVQESIPDREYSSLEFQANEFAGLVLVPPERLKEQFQIAKDRAAQGGVSLENASDSVERMISGHLARAFDVSRDVVTRRLRNDNFWKR